LELRIVGVLSDEAVRIVKSPIAQAVELTATTGDAFRDIFLSE
jgi:hypothetical protein